MSEKQTTLPRYPVNVPMPAGVNPPKPEHPLTADSETKLMRYVTHEDVVRWEQMESRYNNLLAMLRREVERHE